MLKICSIASGSSGNCIYAGTGNTHILIDTGISCRKITTALAEIGAAPESISAILITHEHTDHIRGLGVMLRKFPIPVYATGPTINRILSHSGIGEVNRKLFNEVSPDCGFKIGQLEVHPFRTSHDAAEPVCYTIRKNKKKISIATDLGCYDDYIKEKISGSNILFIEANHDTEMLKNGSYPHFLKKRISGDQGHLSNLMTGRLISEVMGSELRHVMLCHLSRENNTPELALNTVTDVLSEKKCCRQELNLKVSERDGVSEIIEI